MHAPVSKSASISLALATENVSTNFFVVTAHSLFSSPGTSFTLETDPARSDRSKRFPTTTDLDHPLRDLDNELQNDPSDRTGNMPHAARGVMRLVGQLGIPEQIGRTGDEGVFVDSRDRKKVGAEPPDYCVERNSWPVGGTLVVGEDAEIQKRFSGQLEWPAY